MRTNIVINEELLREAMKYTSARTKRAIVEEALRTFVEVKAREQRIGDYKMRANKLVSVLAELHLRQAPSELLREERDSR